MPPASCGGGARLQRARPAADPDPRTRAGLIADAGKPIKAYDLLDKVREGEGAGAAAPPTVYRALDFLLANGFIHKLESVNAFVACHHPNAPSIRCRS
jgi:Fur family zinc uptake transcriptional regulator